MFEPLYRRRGYVIPAWVLIIAAVVFVVWRNNSQETPTLSATTAVTPTLGRMLAGVALVVWALIGLCLLAIWILGLAAGWFRLRLHARPHYGVIYAETFALWMWLFIGVGFAVSSLSLGRWRLLAVGVAELCTLIVLGWPILRGVRWRRVRLDLGLYPGRILGVEMLLGVGVYAAGLALALGSVLAISVVLHAFGGSFRPPSHPAVQKVVQGDWEIRLQVLFLAAVVAPLVEETMFRGLLYRHLREASWRWGRWPSIAAGLAGSSFIFAVIHPQGWLGIPPLMMLATMFALAREWRGSIAPGMVAHGLNNAVAMILTILLFG